MLLTVKIYPWHSHAVLPLLVQGGKIILNDWSILFNIGREKVKWFLTNGCHDNMLQVASVKAEFLAFYIQVNMGSLNRKKILNVAVIGND